MRKDVLAFGKKFNNEVGILKTEMSGGTMRMKKCNRGNRKINSRRSRKTNNTMPNIQRKPTCR